jgi:cytochrome b561
MGSQLKEPTSAPAPSRPRSTSAFMRLMSVHWWMARLYVVLFITGWAMVRWPNDWSWRGNLYDFHKSIGVLTIALLTWRILVLLQVWWRKYTRRRPQTTLEWAKKVALHTLLYIFMWVVPVSGVLFSNSIRAQNVSFFGLPLPDIFPQNAAMVGVARNMHFWLAYTFLAFIVMHMIAQWKVVRAHWRQTQKWVQRKLA